MSDDDFVVTDLSEEEMTERETYTCEECGDRVHMNDVDGGWLDGEGFHCGCES